MFNTQYISTISPPLLDKLSHKSLKQFGSLSCNQQAKKIELKLTTFYYNSPTSTGQYFYCWAADNMTISILESFSVQGSMSCFLQTTQSLSSNCCPRLAEGILGCAPVEIQHKCKHPLDLSSKCLDSCHYATTILHLLNHSGYIVERSSQNNSCNKS